jgi:enoyl-CoA hydratase
VGALVEYRLDNMGRQAEIGQAAVATIAMDDGRVNAISPAMLAELNAAFDRAEADRAVVVLTGREGVFSAGFDLTVLGGGGDEAPLLVRGGFELALRLLSFPLPVVIACPGHAVAMGVFLLLSGDYRIGAAGPYRLMANEVAIGMTLPRVAVEIMRQRLTPAVLSRAALLAERFAPDTAVAAGFLDRVVEPAQLAPAARETAQALAGLDLAAHAETKRRARAATIEAARAGMAADFAGV